MTDLTDDDEFAEWLENELNKDFESTGDIFEDSRKAWLLLARKIRERESERIDKKRVLAENEYLKKKHIVAKSYWEGRKDALKELQSHFFEPLGHNEASSASEDESENADGKKSIQNASEATSFEDWWFGQCKKNHCVEQMRVTSNLGFWKEKCRQAWHEGKKVKK